MILNLLTTQPQLRLYIDSSDHQKQKDCLDDIEYLLLNFDTVNKSLNKDQNLNDLSLNTTTSKLDLSETNNDLKVLRSSTSWQCFVAEILKDLIIKS